MRLTFVQQFLCLANIRTNFHSNNLELEFPTLNLMLSDIANFDLKGSNDRPFPESQNGD